MARTFKYVVLQRINFPSVYNNIAYTPENNFLKLDELEVLNHSGENLLRSGHGAAIGTIDFELSQDNVGSWTDMDVGGQLGLATATRGPNALIDGLYGDDHTIHMNDQNQEVKLSWALELPTAIPIIQIAQAKIYQADENDSINPNHGDLKYRGTGLKLLFFDADRNLIIEYPETKIPQMVYTFTVADVILHEPPTVNFPTYTKVGWMKTSHRWIDNNNWSAGGPMFAVRCHTRNSSDYSFTSEAPRQDNQAYTINFDNNTNVLISQTFWSNSYNYSDTVSEPYFVQKTHSQSPGNLYIAFDDESNVDENTWFIPVTAIWNGMNHSSDNLTAFSHTNYWDATDIAGYEALFGTLTSNHQSGITYNSTAYFYVGPYTAYSGIPNPVPTPPEAVSETDDYSIKFYNYNTGEVLASTEEQVSETETKKINVFTESTTAYLNYDISVAEIKKYVAPLPQMTQTTYNESLVSNISGMAGWYSADQYDASTRVWTDKSTNNNDITGVSASLSVVSNGLNGEPVVAGGTGVSVMFPVGYHYVAPSGTTNYSSYARSEFTMFTVARATTNTFKRVFTGSDDPGLSINNSNQSEQNWYAGHWNDKIGTNFTLFGGFIPTDSNTTRVNSAYSVDPGDNTQFFINTRTRKSSRFNGNEESNITSNDAVGPYKLYINGYSGHESSFECAEVLYFNRTLTTEEIQQVEWYLASKYFPTIISNNWVTSYIVPDDYLQASSNSNSTNEGEVVSSQIVTLDAGVYNIVVDKPEPPPQISSDDLQMEYIASSENVSGTSWTSTYTNDTNTTPTGTVPSIWEYGNDSDGDYFLIKHQNNAAAFKPTYPNESDYYTNFDTNSQYGDPGFTYEAWVKLPSGSSVLGDGQIMGIETGGGPWLILQNTTHVGGIGILPGDSPTHTYNGKTSPGYISDYEGQLVHIVGYMYLSSNTSEKFLRGVWVNGVHYPQNATGLASFTNYRDNPQFDAIHRGFRIGTNREDITNHSSANIQIYSFRVWHRQLTESEVSSIYSWGPQVSILSQPTSDASTNITVDLSTNTIASNVDFEIKYTPIYLSPANNDSGDFPVLQQTDGSPLNYNQYMDQNGEEFRCYEFKNVGETSIVLDRDIVGAKITIIGGGGGGGFWAGGGGGAGGLLVLEDQTLDAGTYNIEVGAGGVGWKQGGGVVPLTIGGDGFYQPQNGKDSAIKRDGTPISLQNNIPALGIGGGGGGNIENLEAGAHTSGRPGGSGGGSGGPWRHSINHEKYTGGASLQGNTLDDDPTSVTNLVPGGYPGNSLINDPLGTHDMKPVMGMGGGGASGVIHADDNASMGWMHLNGQDGVEIKVGGNSRVVAAGGGGSQMGYHPEWHGPGTGTTGMYNTNMLRGLGGMGGGGDGMLWRSRWAQALAGKEYPAHYMRLAQSGEDNTGSGGGGASPGEAGSLEAYYTSGSGGSGLVVIELPRTKVVEDITDEQNDGPVEEEVEEEVDIVLPPHDVVYAIGPGDVTRHPSFRMFEKELDGTFTEKPFGSTLSLDKSYKFIRHPSILGKRHPFVFENSQYYNLTYTKHEVGIVELEDEGVLVFTDTAKEAFNNGLFDKVEYTCMTHPAQMGGFFRLEDESAVPVPTLRSPFLQSGQSTKMDRVILEVIFNKTVHGLNLIDFSATNCKLSNLRGGNRSGSGHDFRVDVEITDPSSSKTCIVQLRQDSVTDNNENSNSISVPFVIEYEYVNKIIPPSELFNIFKDDADIPPEEQMDESEINLVISQAFTIPDPSTPDFDETNDDSEETVSPTRNEKFINPPKFEMPAGIQIKNRKQFKKLMTQVFENVTSEVKSLKIDKTSLVVAQEAEAFISNVEEVVMVKSNQTEPIDVSTLIEDQTKPSATYIPLSEPGSFCVLDIDGVEYTLLVKDDDQCEITNGATDDVSSWPPGSVVELTDTKRFIIGSTTLSIDAVAEEDLIVETQSCFRKDTLITTDQETIKIQNIKPGYHTINGKQIKCITPVYNADGVLVRIEKDCLGENKPSNTVYMQKDHKLLISPAEIAALFSSGQITFERSSTREILYNVLLDSHETMIVENIKAETLNPELTISKYFLEGKPTELKEFIEENTRTIPIV
jgi:hypothetical protein